MANCRSLILRGKKALIDDATGNDGVLGA